MISRMIAYQPVDPAAGLPATRLPLADIVGFFLCRRVRPAFSAGALIDLVDEFRTIACSCGQSFDVQILTAEKINAETASLVRSGQCPRCAAAHDTQLQFQRNGLILSREAGTWFIWLNRVTPNRCGDPIEEHLFWYQVDWTKRNAELAEQLNVPDEVVQSWRRKVAKSKSPAKPKSRTGQTRTSVSRRRGSSANA
jgi:hypothetical protein